MKAVGIRELKNHLSKYLDEVRGGEVVLVTDRGTVIAEIQRPRGRHDQLTPLDQRLRPFLEKGEISVAMRPSQASYQRSPVTVPQSRIESDLDATRADG